MTSKLIEGRINTQRRANMLRDVQGEVQRGGYINVHVAAADYGGNRDLQAYLALMKRMKDQPKNFGMTHSLIGVSPVGQQPNAPPYRELFDPEQTYGLRGLDPWGPRIPTDAKNLLYIAWEDQTGATGYSARGVPLGLAHFIGEGRIPKGKIMLAAELDGGGQKKKGFAHFAALRTYPPEDYVGFFKSLELEAAHSPEMRALLKSMERDGLLDYFAERSTPPPGWSFAEEYRNRQDTTVDNILSFLTRKRQADPVTLDVRRLMRHG